MLSDDELMSAQLINQYIIILFSQNEKQSTVCKDKMYWEFEGLLWNAANMKTGILKTRMLRKCLLRKSIWHDVDVLTHLKESSLGVLAAGNYQITRSCTSEGGISFFSNGKKNANSSQHTVRQILINIIIYQANQELQTNSWFPSLNIPEQKNNQVMSCDSNFSL